jgi:hypothetical protein
MRIVWMANEIPSNDAVLVKFPRGRDTAATVFHLEFLQPQMCRVNFCSLPQEELRPEIIHDVKANV